MIEVQASTSFSERGLATAQPGSPFLGRNPLQSVLNAFYARLLAAGKPKKVAFLACMHKLLIVLIAIACTRMPWSNEIAGIA